MPQQAQGPALRLLFICLGNICRSPAAEAVMVKMLTDAGLQDQVIVDSAGTGDWHAGELADPRMRKAGASRGYSLTHRARQVKSVDFTRFDYLLTMDEQNFKNVAALSPDAASLKRLQRFVAFCSSGAPSEVPDPYHGSSADFDLVLDLLEDGCRGLLREIKGRLG